LFPFVTGCTSYKVNSLTKHEKPKQHEKCALVTKAKLKSREESSAAKIIQTLNKDILIKLDNIPLVVLFGTFKLPFLAHLAIGHVSFCHG
jgi:hypothetical protein